MISGLYQGVTSHCRYLPRRHEFQYSLFMFGVDLDELPALAAQTRFFSCNGFNWAWLRRADYCPGHPELKQAVLDKATQLAGKPVSGRVFMLANARYLGFFFSPVNFYFIGPTGQPEYLLAEVSNTPWNERHYYLVDARQPADHPKAFHVSPFNPMDMDYRWRIVCAPKSVYVQIAAWKSNKVFEASVSLHQRPLTSASLMQRLLITPVMTLKILAGIYCQALRLLIRKFPFYPHPKNGIKHG